MSIIGISGKMQSGKNTVAFIIQYLTHEYELHEQITQSFDNFSKLKYDNNAFTWKQVAFATKLKQIVSILTGIPVEDLEKEEVKNRVLGEEWIRYGYANGFIQKDGKTIMNNEACSKETYEQELKINWQTAYKHQYTVRDILQLIGTEAMRNVIHPNIWINALFAYYKEEIDVNHFKSFKGENSKMIYPNWIITDVRFPNELQAIKDRGGISIRVNRTLESQTRDRLNKEKGLTLTNNNFNKSIFDDLREFEHPSETALDNAKFDYVIDNNGTIEELIEKVKKILIKEKLI